MGGISENETPGMGEEIPKEETYNKYGDVAMKIEIAAIGKHCDLFRIPPFVVPGGGVLNSRKICLRRER